MTARSSCKSQLFMKNRILIVLFFSITNACLCNWQPSEIPEGVYCDADSDCFLLPSGPIIKPVPVLIYLSCTGGKPWDIDSVRAVHDSLGWAIATCGKSRNHRSNESNETDILNLIEKLKATGRIIPSKTILFGFSGQGAQALGTALRYPDIFAGVISDCAHTGSVTYFNPEKSANQIFYIITREQDWNREHNERFHNTLRQAGIRDTLIITPGEHGIGPAWEVFEGCQWIAKEWK